MHTIPTGRTSWDFGRKDIHDGFWILEALTPFPLGSEAILTTRAAMPEAIADGANLPVDSDLVGSVPLAFVPLAFPDAETAAAVVASIEEVFDRELYIRSHDALPHVDRPHVLLVHQASGTCALAPVPDHQIDNHHWVQRVADRLVRLD